MQLSIFLALWALAAFLLTKAVNSILNHRRQHLKARELHCLPPPEYTPGDPFGLSNSRKTLRAFKNNWAPEDQIERIHAVSAREGRLVTTYAQRTFFNKIIVTCEPRNVQAVLATQFKDFALGRLRNGNFGTLLGHGIFASDGKAWEHSRAMLRPQFARDQINDLELEETHVQKLLRVMPLRNSPGAWSDTFDIQPLFFRLTMDAATEFLFGESVNSQLAELAGGAVNGHHSARAFSYSFDQAQTLMNRASQFGEYYRLGHTREYWRHVKQVHEFVDYYVGLALNKGTLREKEVTGDGKKPKYVFLEAIAKETQDPEELRDQLLNILLAGRDTTASLLSWLFLHLARNPDIFAKLRQTVLDDFGTYSKPMSITFESLKNSAYLQNTLKETLRLHAIVPMNVRSATVDTSLPLGGGPDGKSPVFVPKDTQVRYSVHAMHKRKDIWGEDVAEFRPERWEGRKNGWEYLPFNGGPRICIGQQFALTEASYVMVRLLQKFDGLEGYVSDATPRMRVTLTSSPADGVKMRLREAKE